MNFLCHVRVARACGDDDRFVLGSILPDIESLVGQTLEAARSDPLIGRGIALHKATDAAFHDDPRFRSGSIALTRALQARGIGRGPSRAVGHAGWELLLDGLLVDDAATTAAFTAANDALLRLLPAAGSGHERLRVLAHRQRDAPIWTGYADPAVVAARLQRQLQARPLLSFPEHQLDEVTDELRHVLPDIHEVGPDLIADVTRSVKAAS
jgi:hypothetical protein